MKVAVCGFGYWAVNVVRALCRLLPPGGIRVAEPVPERREAAERSFPGVRAEAGLEPALGDPAVGAVFVCVPSGMHFETASRALDAGKSVFVEKPFTTNARDAALLFERARANSRVAYPGHVFLHTRLFDHLREVLQSGELGALRYAVSLRASLGPRAREDVKVVWDYLIHDVYIFNRLLGGPPLNVSARGRAYLREGVEDVSFALLEYPGGFLINCYTSWHAPEKIRSLLLVGSQAMLQHAGTDGDPVRHFRAGFAPHAGRDPHGNAGLRLFDEGVRAVPLGPGEEPLQREISAFLKLAAEKRQPDWVERHVVEVAATLEAIDKSISLGGAQVEVAAQGVSR